MLSSKVYEKRYRDSTRGICPYVEVANSIGDEHMENEKGTGGGKHNYKQGDVIEANYGLN